MSKVEGHTIVIDGKLAAPGDRIRLGETIYEGFPAGTLATVHSVYGGGLSYPLSAVVDGYEHQGPLALRADEVLEVVRTGLVGGSTPAPRRDTNSGALVSSEGAPVGHIDREALAESTHGKGARVESSLTFTVDEYGTVWAGDLLPRDEWSEVSVLTLHLDRLDRSSSVSRQHYIDTGRYLTHAEVAEAGEE